MTQTQTLSLTPQVKTWLHVLQERNMRWYFGTQLISLTGLMLRSALMALLVIDIVGEKNAPPYVGAVWALSVLPGALLAVYAGMVVDRTDKRRMLRITSILGMIQAVALAYLTFSDLHSVAIWKVMAVAAFGGLSGVFDGIARSAIIKDAIVETSNLQMGGVMFNSLYTVGMILGNGVAGYLVLTIGYTSSFILNACSFLILLIGLAQMDFSHLEKRTVTGSKIGDWESMKRGIYEAFAHQTIRTIIIVSTFITVFGYAYNIILSIIAKTMFMGGPKEFSYLASMNGIGSLIGTFIAVHWGNRNPLRWIIAGLLVTGTGQILFSQSTNINHAAVLVLLCGCGFMVAFSPFRGAIMHIVERPKIGMVLGINFSFFYGGMTISSLTAGFVAKRFGCPIVLLCSGTALLLLAYITPKLPGIKKIG